MGLFGSSSSTDTVDPAVKQMEKVVANEAREDERSLKHAMKDLQSVEKSHTKVSTEAEKAEQAIAKAIKKEHATADALNKAEHKHDTAVADQKNTRKKAELKRQQEGQLAHDVQQHRSSLDQVQHSKDANDQMRASKLAQVHEQAAQRQGSLDVAPGQGSAGAAGDAPASPTT